MNRDDQQQDEKKPPATTPPSVVVRIAEEKQKPKKKRRSPAVPWKKPKDMPKRPLSAYNLFFKARREEFINSSLSVNAGPRSKGGKATGGASDNPRRSPTSCGMGFANLAKTIAAEWKTLDDSTKAPFEEQAAKEKQLYDVAVSEWRLKQKEVKDSPSPKKKIETIHEQRASSPGPLSISSNQSMTSFSGPYPSDWFDWSPRPPQRRSTEGEDAHVPSEINASHVDESPRNHDSFTSLGSSYRSLDVGLLQSFQEPPSPMANVHHVSYSSVSQSSNNSFSYGGTPNRLHSSMGSFHGIAVSPHVSVMPREVQDGMGVHEFARALTLEPSPQPLSQPVAAPMPRLHMPSREVQHPRQAFQREYEMMEAFDPIPYYNRSSFASSSTPVLMRGSVDNFSGSVPPGARTGPTFRVPRSASMPPMPRMYSPHGTNNAARVDTREGSHSMFGALPPPPLFGDFRRQQSHPITGQHYQPPPSHRSAGEDGQALADGLNDEAIDFITNLRLP